VTDPRIFPAGTRVLWADPYGGSQPAQVIGPGDHPHLLAIRIHGRTVVQARRDRVSYPLR
jgi:hypothetical protein